MHQDQSRRLCPQQPLRLAHRPLRAVRAVEWHERVAPRAMGDLYRTLDIFVATSRGSEEGFFMPSIEAMACGVPCVLTDIPCANDYDEHRDYALFVPPTVVMPHIKAGRLRALGFTGARRWQFMPDLPTIAEAGCAAAKAERSNPSSLLALLAPLRRCA